MARTLATQEVMQTMTYFRIDSEFFHTEQPLEELSHILAEALEGKGVYYLHNVTPILPNGAATGEGTLAIRAGAPVTAIAWEDTSPG
jgi:hypothetical protein